MKICMVGAGYVGLVSGACFADLGNTVYCVDKNKDKIDSLNRNQVPIFEPGLKELIYKNYLSKRLKFTTDLRLAVKNSDIIFICVGTPALKKNGSADLQYVFKVSHELMKSINKFKVIVTKSTVPISTGDKIEKIISKRVNKKYFEVVSNPEFLREGEAIRDFRYPDRIVVGSNSKRAFKKLKDLYDPLIKKGAKFLETNRRGAELIKYASNSFLATKITFMNEIANLCEKTNVNAEDVAIGIGLDQRIGSRFLRVGPGYGGSCFPKDTKAITITGDSYKTNLSIIKAVIKSNENRKILLTKKIEEILSNRVKNKVITFLGVTFKANTDDMRDSSSLFMIPFLLRKGAKIKYYDPTGEKEEFRDLKNLTYCNSVKKACDKTDLLIIHTDWEEFKVLAFEQLSKNKNFKIYDMRNLYSLDDMRKKSFKYYSIGR